MCVSGKIKRHRVAKQAQLYEVDEEWAMHMFNFC